VIRRPLKRLRNRLGEWLAYSVRRRLLDRDLETVKREMKGRVLEVGNGHAKRRGRFQPPVEEAKTWTFVDQDAKRDPDIQADVQSLPINAAAFDTVVCLEVLEYVTSPTAALCEIRRVLKPGGRLILSAPFFHRRDHAHDYWRFTDNGLRADLDRSGFEVVALHSQGGPLEVAVNILKYVVYAQPPGWKRDGLAALAYLPLTALSGLDRRVTAKHPVLFTFSTGYLVVAKAVAAS